MVLGAIEAFGDTHPAPLPMAHVSPCSFRIGHSSGPTSSIDLSPIDGASFADIFQRYLSIAPAADGMVDIAFHLQHGLRPAADE